MVTFLLWLPQPETFRKECAEYDSQRLQVLKQLIMENEANNKIFELHCVSA